MTLTFNKRSHRLKESWRVQRQQFEIKTNVLQGEVLFKEAKLDFETMELGLEKITRDVERLVKEKNNI